MYFPPTLNKNSRDSAVEKTGINILINIPGKEATEVRFLGVMLDPPLN